MSEFWAIVPARAGSKGVSDKNIKPLGGHPLLAWSVRAGVKARNISRVIMSTDSARYAEIAKSYGAEAPFSRPLEFATDVAPDFAFMNHAVQWFLANEGKVADFFVHLRPTTPLREVRYVEDAVERIKREDAVTALRSVHEMSESSYKTFELADGLLRQVGSGNMALDAANAARQFFPKTYSANGYVDIVRTSLIRERRLLHGDRVHGFVTPRAGEVDTIEDFEYLDYEVQRKPEFARALFA